MGRVVPGIFVNGTPVAGSRPRGAFLLAVPPRRPAGLAPAGVQRRRGPVHHPRRRAGPPRRARHQRSAVRPGAGPGRDRRRSAIEVGDRGAGAGPDHRGPRHRCRDRAADPPCPARGPVLQGGRGPRQPVRGRRPGPLPHESRCRPTATASRVASTSGPPYLGTSTAIFDWPKGTLEHRIDLALHRGVLIRGKVVEEGIGPARRRGDGQLRDEAERPSRTAPRAATRSRGRTARSSSRCCPARAT